jgi:RNA recognition motif-containing protein
MESNTMKTTFHQRTPSEIIPKFLRMTHRTLFVGNIGMANEYDLRILFEPFGTVTDVHIVLTPEGKSRQFAFVTFKTFEQASAAKNGLHGESLYGGDIRVHYPVAKRRKSSFL